MSVCLIVAISGRTIPPTVPTFFRDSASDLRDFRGVLPLLHVHQLAFPRADEAALLRPAPIAPLALYLRAEFQESVHQGHRWDRATSGEDVGRDEAVGALDAAVGVVVLAAAD